ARQLSGAFRATVARIPYRRRVPSDDIEAVVRALVLFEVLADELRFHRVQYIAVPRTLHLDDHGGGVEIVRRLPRNDGEHVNISTLPLHIPAGAPANHEFATGNDSA